MCFFVNVCFFNLLTWLSTNSNSSNKSQDQIDHFLNNLDNFDLNEYIKAIHFDEIKVPFVPFYNVIIYLINHPKLRNAIKNFIPPVVE